LEKVPCRLGEEDEAIGLFVANELAEYSFSSKDILAKLPNPIILGGSSRRSKYFKFAYDFKNWNLAY